MGRDLEKSRFSDQDFEGFRDKLRGETALLARWFRDGVFENHGKSLGLELETWLVDANFLPAPHNKEFLTQLNHPKVVPELSAFNAEINATPQTIGKNCLKSTKCDLIATWFAIQTCAKKLGYRMMMVGTLPTLRDEMLDIKYMSDMDRYRALNEQVLFLRKGHPLKLDISGLESLQSTHFDIMLEAAATSMQVHLKIEADVADRYYNASLIVSAACVAISANSPYLFGRSLWDETRIPIFEQAVNLPSFHDPKGRVINRVSFGSGYVRNSLLEVFLENLDCYSILLPMVRENGPDKMDHVRLHNGCIWRWNRPILGFDRVGKPHLRIEHRVAGAGPTMCDIVANVAFYLGLTHYYATQVEPPEQKLPFAEARKNFYEAAKLGLRADVKWLNGKTVSLKKLIHDKLLPQAREGLEKLGLGYDEVEYYLGEIMRNRVKKERTGAFWQRAFIEKHGPDFQAMAEEYFRWQEEEIPVHAWKI